MSTYYSPKNLLRRIYHNQKGSAARRNIDPPSYTLAEFREWALTTTNYLDLHEAWVTSGCQRKYSPSPDRQDESKGYCLDNIKFVTNEENYMRHANEQVTEGKTTSDATPIKVSTKAGTLIGEFPSVTQACRQLGLPMTSMSNIYSVLDKPKRSAYKYRWETIC